jgi:hypothetical protein
MVRMGIRIPRLEVSWSMGTRTALKSRSRSEFVRHHHGVERRRVVGRSLSSPKIKMGPCDTVLKKG